MSEPPRQFQFTLHKDQLSDAQAELYHFFGHTMTRWSQLETALFYWFARITKMPERMSRAIFYGARGFAARAEMLESAVENTADLTPDQARLLKEALKKARNYSAFRNKIAHGEPRLNIIERDQTNVHYTITQGKTPVSGDQAAITLEDLAIAAHNILILTSCIRDTLPFFRKTHGDVQSPEECLAQVLALPTEPNSKSGPTGAASAPQPQEPQHRDKKAYRAEQAAKKPPEDG